MTNINFYRLTIFLFTITAATAPGGSLSFEAQQSSEIDDNMETLLEKVNRRVLTHGKVCPDPARPCDGFKSNELSFEITKKVDVERGRDKSLPFYAIILKTAKLCSITEEERQQVQAQFPRWKVFVHQYFCEDFGDNVTYTNVNEKYGFIAIYAGETEGDARKLLSVVTKKFPDANIRKMEVIVVYQTE